MISVMIVTGILSAIVITTGAAVLMAAVALTDVHDKLKQWVMHKVWW